MTALEGTTVLITGAGSGIGKASAALIGAAGAHVIVADVRGAEESAKEIVAAGGTATAVDHDVRHSSSWKGVVDDAIAAHGRIDTLVNVAGVVTQGLDTVVDQTEEEWDRVHSVNLKGAWLGMKTVYPHFIEHGGGRVVNVSSLAGLIGMVNVMSYSASKGGLIGLTRQAAIEYAPHKIHVNVVCPGIIETPMLGEISPELYDACVAGTPLGRLGEPADIGHTVMHLLGPGGNFVTGQVFPVDGGWSAQ
jgi:NAD(P)-dependent dehydrogenase (short-subunit alcohol dehydrogenase family)